jgi:hypothetical protein
MARYDKSDPINSTFRIDVAADFPDANLGKLYGVGEDAEGKLVFGNGASGMVGVVVVTEKPGRVGPLRDVSRVDVMYSGCITDFGPTTGDPGVDFGVAGTKYFAHPTTGEISDTPVVGSYYVGKTVEPDRLEVNFNDVPLIAGQFGLT